MPKLLPWLLLSGCFYGVVVVVVAVVVVWVVLR
jgi:hypothetical protein